MITLKTANLRISMWFLIPVSIATGMLAATIAVGGFIGVPGLMYIVGCSAIVASATELVIAFVMGLGGTLIWAYYGMVDIRLVMLILAGSLFGVQLGAIGTTYVKEYMIKYVMATIMLRITSYNVCYTKLLRHRTKRGRRAFPGCLRPASRFVPAAPAAA